MADDKLVNAYKASRNAKAPVKGKKSAKGSSLLAGARASAPIEAPKAAPEKPKDWWEQTTEVLGDVVETPVIKQIIDALSAPMYAVDNSLSNIQTRMQDASRKGRERGEVGINNLPNTIQTAWEGLNPGSFIGDVVSGVGKGLSAGVGNKNDVKTAADLIKSGQEFNNIDPNTDAAKWTQGLGGFGLDVVMDPLNAVTGLGKAAAATKGAVRGAQQFRSEAAGARKIGEMAEGVENTRWENAKKQAGVEVAKYKELKATDQQAKEVRKQTKNKDAATKAQFLIENISSLKPSVFKAVATDDAVKAELIAKAEDLPTEQMAEVIDKLSEPGAKAAEKTLESADDFNIPFDETLPEKAKVPKSRPLADRVGLAQFKQPTVAENVFDKLAKLRTTNKTPVYDKAVLKAVEDAEKARPATIEKLVPAEKVAPVKEAMTDANKVPDIKATVKALREFDKEMGGGTMFPVVGPNGKKMGLHIDDLINTLDPRDELFKSNWDAIQEFQVYKAPEPQNLPPVPPTKVTEKNPKALTDDDYAKLGVKPEHIALIRQGIKLADIVDEVSVGDIRAITRDMRSGAIPQKVVDQFYDVVGDADPKKVAKFIDELAKTPEFKATSTEMKKYGSVRTGETPDPTRGVSGHGKFAMPMPGKGFGPEDILAAKTPANPEQTRKFLEAEYNRVASNLATHKYGVELRQIADQLFEGTINEQARPAGPLRALGGASVKQDLTAAKYETRYNTHSGMWRTAKAIEYARGLEKAGKTTNRSQMDDVIMSLLQDVDARLRLAGFDQHLSNMQVVGDKLVVRLAPSDVLMALTREDRIKYLWGNKAYNKAKEGELHEFLPTTLLDLGEVLVRSATKLTPTGQIDMEALVNNAIYTLQGKYSEVASGKRVIVNNLDANTRWKNDTEILRQLDKDVQGDTAFFTQYKAAKSPADRQAVIDLAMKLHPDEFNKIVTKRTDKITHELFSRFTKGMAEGKPGPLNELININMRNAALMGGTVAKQVGEASAEYSAKVLETLNNGTIGDHLSALVSKPPFPTTDKAVQAVLKENKTVVQHSAATPEELRHVEKLNENVIAGQKLPKTKAEKKAAKLAGNKVNKEAYQKEPQLTEELTKPLDEVNTEKVFDLHAREVNRDILIRMFGTSRFFNKRSGIPIAFDTIAGSTHASSLLMTGFHEILRDLTRKGYTNEQLRVAFDSLKVGPPVDQISAELNAVISTMFDTSKTNFLARNSVGPEHFNKILEKVGFDEQFRVPLNATKAEMMNAWKQWDVVDVKDFFSKMMGAMVKTAEDVSMGASFSKHFGRDTPAPGYVKIMDSGSGDARNQFIDLIDQNLYYPKELTGEFVHIGRLLTESRSFKPGTATHTFVTKIMDPVISNLKMTQTTMKPGHHVMSIIGDGWRNNLALSTIGFVNPARQVSLYGESARILFSNVGDIEELSSFQKFQRTQGISSELAIAKKGQTGSEFYPNIKGGGRIGHKDMYALMQTHGIALPAHLGGMAEDFLADFDTLGAKTTSRVVNGVAKVTEGLDRLANPIKPKFGMKNPYSLNKFTANRDTWTRGALFLGAMRSRNFSSIEEAVKFSADFVHKWSPTAQDLGAFEAKYLRRGIFYYTWIRGMVPRIIEGTLMRPGIATIPNKAMYNLAIANGIDPNSVGDPFPDGELFPSWYTERVIGPQYKAGGDLWGMNPTGPLGDVLNSLGSNIKPKDFLSAEAFTKTTGTLLNMSNPFFKAPAEIITGRTLETGAPIDDKAQYLQDYVGPARFASRATGKELFPSVGPEGVGFANRTESKFRDGLTEEERRLNAMPEILNYLTGMGFTNYTSESAKKSAQFQQKDELAKAKKEAERFK